jgi:hypothetical protein
MLKFLLQNTSETYISPSQKKEDFIKEFFEQVKEELPYAYVQRTDIHQSESELVFNAKPFRYIWNGWNIFNPVIRGEFRFESVSNLLKLKTRMYFTEFFITAALLSFASVPAFVLGVYGWGIAWLIGLWLIFYGGSRLLHSLRLKMKIKDLIRQTEHINKQGRTLKDVWQEDRGFIDDVFGHIFVRKTAKKKAKKSR